MAPSTPPTARRIPSERTHHGDTVIDQYEWLRNKGDPQVLDHPEAENAYATAQTDALEPLRQRIFVEITAHTRETDHSVPVRNGDWWYYSRSFEGAQYTANARTPISARDDWTPPELASDPTSTVPITPLAGEQIILDSNIEAEGHDFFSLGSFDISTDGTLLAYAVDTVGDERFTLRIRDLSTRTDLPDEVPNTFHGAVFSPDGRFVFYTTVDDAWRPDTVWRHEVGTPADADVAVFHEPSEKYWTAVRVTRSRRYLVIDVGSAITSETRLLDATDPTGEFVVVWPRREGVEYSVDHAVVEESDRLLILHNDHAENFELVEVAASDPGGPRITLLPHDSAMRLESVDAFADHIVVEYRKDALARVGVLPLLRNSYGPITDVEFDEPIYTVTTGSNPEWTQPNVRLVYGSLATPSTVFDYDPVRGELHRLKQQAVLGNFDPARYEQRREWARADDGTLIPISLVYRRDRLVSGEPAPLELYGYGSYEASIDPSFSIPRLALLDRGVIYAIAHVRGGGELGRAWYENGKTLTKKNTFSDFVASARHLVESGWTTSEKIVAEGRSAGGLLMGAVANLAPEAFAGILAGVPFVDALTSILDPSLPLTVTEWDEWGDPLHDPEVYAYMKSYTPYENVREGVDYPRILATTSFNDTRVLYVEPAKWVARLRAVGAPALLKTEMSAGHGGVSGRYQAWKERAWELAWVLDVLGLAGQPAT